MLELLRRILGLGKQASPRAAEPDYEGTSDREGEYEVGPDFYAEGSPFDGAGPFPFEEDLARELAPLLTQGGMPTPGGNGATRLDIAEEMRAAAVLRYGGLLGRRQSAESFLLIRGEAAAEPRVLMGVTEGNYKAPITGLAGVITLSTLAHHVCGALRTQDLESDLRQGFTRALERLNEVAELRPYFARWRFNSFFWHGPAPLEDPGSSVTALALRGSTAVLGHIGEGRAYLLRRGELRRLSADHTLAAQANDLPPESLSPDFLTIPAKVLLAGQSQVSDVQFEQFELEPLDTILLGSANLFENDSSANRVREVLAANAPADACDALLQLPEPRARHDRSITAVIARLGSLHRSV